MDKNTQANNRLADRVTTLPRRPSLRLVSARFQLAQPSKPAPEDWSEGLSRLLDWLAIDADIIPAARTRRLTKMANWTMPSAAPLRHVPVFAPWLGWSPTAFQHGGLNGLPQALWAGSYLHDQGRGLTLPQRTIDVALMSPHPDTCAADKVGEAPLPRAGVLAAMIRAAKAEGRESCAIICHARQRNGIARQLLAADRTLTRDGLALEILTIEDALRLLMDGASPWDAIIVMPDLRSIIATLLRETSGVRGPWPMLWHGGGRGDAVRLIASEAAGAGAVFPALDATALIHALALALHRAGFHHAAARLHEGWVRLRDSGVTTPTRGSDAPYVSQVHDADFIAMLCGGRAVSTRPVHHWRALGSAASALCKSRAPGLRIIAANPAVPPR